MALPQVISLVSTVLLTSIAIIVGIQLIYVLRELRHTLAKVNQTVDTVSETLDKIAQPALGIFAILEGLKESSKIIELVSGFLNKNKAHSSTDEEFYDNSI